MIATGELVSAEDLSAMHDAALSTPHRERVRRHAAGCPSCTNLLAVWRDTDRELMRAAVHGRRHILLAPAAVLLMVLLTAGIATAAGLGPFRVLRVVPTPEVVGRGAAVLARGESLAELRSLTGLPLPDSAELNESWRLLGAIKSTSGGAVLTYGRGQDQLTVNVMPLASRPGVVADPEHTEEVAVAGAPALLVRRVPSQSFEAVFENGNSGVVITTNGGTVSREELLALITAWRSTAR